MTAFQHRDGADGRSTATSDVRPGGFPTNEQGSLAAALICWVFMLGFVRCVTFARPLRRVDVIRPSTLPGPLQPSPRPWSNPK